GASSVISLALREWLRFREIEITVLKSHHVKKSGIGTVRRRKPIRGTHNSRADVRARFRRQSIRQNRAAGSIDSLCPIQFLDEWRRMQEFPVAAIQDVEESVAVGLHQQMTCRAILFYIHQHRC